MGQSPLKWHGGKHYLAERIVELMPPHLHYVEPFFGGGAVLLRRDPTRDWYAGAADWSGKAAERGCSEVVNDIHSELTTFWRVLQDEATFARFQRKMQAVPFSQVEFQDAAGPATDEDPVEQAVRFFIRIRQSRQGLGYAFATLSRNRTRRSMNEQVASWSSTVEGLPEIHDRLRRVVILNDDARKVIKQQDDSRTLIYCDPPYMHETRHGRGANSDYEFEMTTEEHEALLTVLAEIEGHFILSGYRCALYDDMAARHGWKRIDWKIDNKASRSATKETKTESVWLNFEPKGFRPSHQDSRLLF